MGNARSMNRLEDLSRHTGASGLVEMLRELLQGAAVAVNTLASAPKDGGAYALLIRVDAATIFPRRPSPHRFAPGWYVYAGSAYGPGGMRARITRHSPAARQSAGMSTI